MSIITASIAPSDLAGPPTSRGSASADPAEFAVELQTATDGAASSTGGQAGTTTDPAGGLAQAGPVAPALVPTEPHTPAAAGGSTAPQATAPGAAPVVPTADPAGTGTSAVPLGAQPTGAAPLAAVPQDSPAQGAAPQGAAPQYAAPASELPASGAAPASDQPSVGHRTGRHAAGDALPGPISASAAASATVLPPAASAVASSPLAAHPAATTPGDDTSTVAAAADVLTAPGQPAPGQPGASQPGVSQPGVSQPAGPVRAGSRAAALTDASGGNAADLGSASSSQPAPAPATVPVLPGLETAPPVPAAAAIGNLARPAARVVAAPTSAPQAFAAALAQPTVSQPASAASIGAPAAPQAPAPLNQQLAPPLLGLRTAGEGTHVLTLTVSPDAVGPVTVRAHVTGDTMRIELSAPTGQGTDALKAMLPDLKRDLAQGGLGSALTIASPGSDSSAAGSQNPFGGAGGAFDQNDRPNYFRSTGSSTVPVSAGSSTATTVGATSALDVLV